MVDKKSIAVVVIGRNEGERLQSSLDSARLSSDNVVYVDSGSTDDSLRLAAKNGVLIVELDDSRPYTAARARNDGFVTVQHRFPSVKYVQFLDGDCELDANWLESAFRFFHNNSGVAAVCGRLRERYPERSVYNLLCDIEWCHPAGEIEATGGIFCVRCDAFNESSGFREDLIAGEESELCSRIIAAGWKIWRIDFEMALHDANMMHFSQWWNRAVRCGFTYAQGYHEMDKKYLRERNRAILWGAFLPIMLIVSIYIWGLGALSLITLYLLQVLRLTFKGSQTTRRNFINALFLTIGKFPEMVGILKYYLNRGFGITNKLIEYK